MKQSIIIDFIIGYFDDEVEFYFEIQKNRIFLCKVLPKEDRWDNDVETIKKVVISMNPDYIKWLKYHSGTYYAGTESETTELNHLFRNNYWFVSTEHSNFDKYIKELKYHMEELNKEE